MLKTSPLRILLASGAVASIFGFVSSADARLGPGFDCTKAKQPLAQLICASDDLSRIDYYMNQAYNAYTATLDVTGKKRLAQDQVAFINKVIDLCHIPDDLSPEEIDAQSEAVITGSRCVGKAYSDRTAQLSGLAQKAGATVSGPAATQQQPLLSAPNSLAVVKVPTIATKDDQILVQGSINGRPVTFMVDSGATAVGIPSLIAKKLDLGPQIDSAAVSFADGRTAVYPVYRIDVLSIGEAKIQNVSAIVGGDGDSILLGRTALNKFDSWSVDTRNGMLLLFKDQGSASRASNPPQKNPAPATSPRVAAVPQLPSTPSANFDKFPGGPRYQGTLVMPDFQGRDKDYNKFRTRIRNGIQEGANFAGRYKVIQFGCGTGCSFVIVADVSTGRVLSFPHGGEFDQCFN